MTIAIVLLSMWGPIGLGFWALHLVDKARTRWGARFWGVVGVLCILWLVGWLVQWIFCSSRWWQIANNGGGMWG